MWVLELDLEEVISELSGGSRTACFCMVGFLKQQRQTFLIAATVVTNTTLVHFCKRVYKVSVKEC